MVDKKAIVREVLFEKEITKNRNKVPKIELTTEEQKEYKRRVEELIDILMDMDFLTEWWDYEDFN